MCNGTTLALLRMDGYIPIEKQLLMRDDNNGAKIWLTFFNIWIGISSLLQFLFLKLFNVLIIVVAVTGRKANESIWRGITLSKESWA